MCHVVRAPGGLRHFIEPSFECLAPSTTRIVDAAHRDDSLHGTLHHNSDRSQILDESKRRACIALSLGGDSYHWEVCAWRGERVLRTENNGYEESAVYYMPGLGPGGR